MRTGLLIGLGCHDQLVQALHRPAVFNKVGGKIIQQARMGRLRAFHPEVVRIAGNGFAEVVLPDAVYD